MKILTPERKAELFADIKHRIGLKRWICETLRELYDDILKVEDEELRERMTETLIYAYDMAKRMNERLIKYKSDYDNGLSEMLSHEERLKKAKERSGRV